MATQNSVRSGGRGGGGGVRWRIDLAKKHSLARLSECSMREIMIRELIVREKGIDKALKRRENIKQYITDFNNRILSINYELPNKEAMLTKNISEGVLDQREVDQWRHFFSTKSQREIEHALLQTPSNTLWIFNNIRTIASLERERDQLLAWVDYYTRVARRSDATEQLWKFEADKARKEIERAKENDTILETKKKALLSHLRRQILDEVGRNPASVRKQPDPAAPPSVHANGVRGTEEELRVLKALDSLD